MRTITSGALVAGAVILGCGGIAIIDADDDGAGGSSATTSTTTTTTSTGATMTTCERCLAADISNTGALAHPELTEASGLTASRIHEDVFYTHNDSGGAPRFFAIDAKGTDLATYVVNQAAAVDWEDIEAGPCDEAGEPCLYIADIGDNAEERGSYVIYRVREPGSITPGGNNISADVFNFTYADGSHNAEAVVVDPSTADLYIITKTDVGSPGLYRHPAPLAPNAVLSRVADVSIPTGVSLVTGGSAHENGVLLRTYTNVILYDVGADVQSRLSGPGCAVTAPSELQGEAIAWRRAGDGYLTVSEAIAAPVYEMRCSSAAFCCSRYSPSCGGAVV